MTGAVVHPDGTLYSCWESAGQPGFAVGDTTRGFTAPDEALDEIWVQCGYLDPVGKAWLRGLEDEVGGRVLDWMAEEGLL